MTRLLNVFFLPVLRNYKQLYSTNGNDTKKFPTFENRSWNQMVLDLDKNRVVIFAESIAIWGNKITKRDFAEPLKSLQNVPVFLSKKSQISTVSKKNGPCWQSGKMRLPSKKINISPKNGILSR